LKEHGVEVTIAEVEPAWQNGYAERLLGTLKIGMTTGRNVAKCEVINVSEEAQ
jgi:hypothetical protein